MAEKDELDELLYLRQENIKLKARLDTNRAQVKKMAEEKRKVCRVVNHIYIGGICAECGKREMPPKKAVEQSVQRTGLWRCKDCGFESGVEYAICVKCKSPRR